MWLVLGIIVVFIVVLPFILKGEDVRHKNMIFDDLEINHSYMYKISRQIKFFLPLDYTFDNLLGGVKIGGILSELNLYTLLFRFLPPFWAFVMNQVLVRFIAFVGMYLLVDAYLLADAFLLKIGVATCFSLLPFFMPARASVAAQPLLLFALLNIITNNFSLFDWMIMFLYPFYADFALGGAFVVIFMWLFYVIASLLNGNFAILPFYALSLMSISVILVEFRLFYMMFVCKNYTFHREEYNDYKLKKALGLVQDLKQSFIKALDFMLNGYPCDGVTLARPIIVLSILAGCLICLDSHVSISFFITLGLSAVVCLFSSFWFGYDELLKFRSQHPLLKKFNLRFHVVLPILTYLLWSVSLSLIYVSHVKWAYIIVYSQVLYSFYYNFASFCIGKKDVPSYKEFFAVNLFDKLKSYIGKSTADFRVACVGFHPAVAIYNDFYTLDGYSTIYSLEHKHKFRNIIRNELTKNIKDRDYFDYWGSRCYIFTPCDGNIYSKSKFLQYSQDLDLDIDAFKELGGKYILSAIKISNYANIGLELKNKFEDIDSYYDIYLYEAL